MNYVVCICLALVASLHAPVSGPREDAKAMQGEWKPVKAVLAGRPLSDSLLNVITLTLNNGTYQVLVGNQPDKGTYTLDSVGTPRGMTITGTEGPNRGRTFPAIYEIRKDTLRICYDLAGAKRPAEFKSEPGTLLYLVTYNRVKR